MDSDKFAIITASILLAIFIPYMVVHGVMVNQHIESLKRDCTKTNLEHYVRQMDIVASIEPFTTRESSSFRGISSYRQSSAAYEHIIRRNLESVIEPIGCPADISDAVKNMRQSLRGFNHVAYDGWRRVLVTYIDDASRW
jgi:hypothetical protein